MYVAPACAACGLTGLLLALPAEDEELQHLLARFGWAGNAVGFVRPLDVGGLRAALQKYLWLKVADLGSGAYSSVWKATNRETQESTAVKQMRTTEYGMCDATIREIATLRELHHSNIIGLRDVIYAPGGKYCYLLLELLACDLATFLTHAPAAGELTTIKSIMFQVLSGLRHAHSHSIMHRDLKPHNILLGDAPVMVVAAAAAAAAATVGHSCDAAAAAAAAKQPPTQRRRTVVKIADFGLARGYLPDAGTAYTDWVVTLYYRAPELLLGSRSYGPGVDVWAAGCVLAEMLNMAPLFKSNCEIGLLHDMFSKLGTPSKDSWPELPHLANYSELFPQWPAVPLHKLVPRLAADPLGADLLACMLSFDPRRRITARAALQHPWFDDVRAVELAAAAAAAAAP